MNVEDVTFGPLDDEPVGGGALLGSLQLDLSGDALPAVRFAPEQTPRPVAAVLPPTCQQHQRRESSTEDERREKPEPLVW